MTDWIKVFLGWDQEEESGAEEILREQDREAVPARREQAAEDAAQSGRAESAGGTWERMKAAQAVTADEERPSKASALEFRARETKAEPEEAEALEEARENGAAALARELEQMGVQDRSQPASAGEFARNGQEAEGLVWRRAGQEALEAVTAAAQAEKAAEHTQRQTEGGSRQLEAALDRPNLSQSPAGVLLRTMVVTEQAAAYRTVERMASQEENLRWQGADPARLDRIFERDARRYDSGFRLY